MHLFTVLLLILLSLPSPLFAQETEEVNAGFVSGVWYSKLPFFAGETVRIYSAIHNQSEFDILGRVQFLDGDTLIGDTDFSTIRGRLVEVWTDWEMSQGMHRISVAIVDAKKSEIGKEPQPITLKFSSSLVDEQFADLDTDGDLKGDLESIKNIVEPATNKVDSFRADLQERVETKRDEVAAEIAKAQKSQEENNAAKITFREIGQAAKDRDAKTVTSYGYLLALSAVAFVLKTKLLFYSIFLVLFFLLVRRILRGRLKSS